MSVAIHKVRVGGLSAPISIIASDVNNVTNNKVSSPVDFASISVGASQGGKHLVACLTNCTNGGGSGNSTITALTVDPAGDNISMSKLTGIQANDGNETNEATIWIADITAISGSTVTLRITFTPAGGGQPHSFGLSTVAITAPVSAAAEDTATGSDDSIEAFATTTTTLEGSSGGFVVGCSFHDIREETVTWSSITERAEATTNGGGHDHSHSAAWDVLESGRTAATETVTWTNSSDIKALCCATIR